MSYEEATPQLLSYCMFNFITIIKPTIIPSIRVAKVDYCSVNQSPYVLFGSGIDVIICLRRNATGNAMCIYMRERPSVVSVCMCNSSDSMSFLDIEDPAKTNGSSRRVCKSKENCPTTQYGE